MNISQSIYTSFLDGNNKFDINEFIMSVLLFDRLLLADPSILPALIRSVGVEGLFRLVNEGILQVVGGGPSCQANYDYKNPGFFMGKDLNKPLRFGFETIYIDPKQQNNHLTSERLLLDLKREKMGSH